MKNRERAGATTVAELLAGLGAEAEGLKGLANIICLGKLWSLTNFCEREVADAAITKCVPPKRKHLLEPNLRAFQLGIDA